MKRIISSTLDVLLGHCRVRGAFAAPLRGGTLNRTRRSPADLVSEFPCCHCLSAGTLTLLQLVSDVVALTSPKGHAKGTKQRWH